MAAGRVVVLRNEDSYRRVSKREFSLSRVGTRRAELVNWHDIGHRASYEDDLVIQPGKGHSGPRRCGFDKVETSCFADVIQLPPQKRRKFSPILWDGETMAKSFARSKVPENAVSATPSLLEPHTKSLGSCDLVYHGSHTHGEISDSAVSFAHLSQEVNEEQDQIAEQFQPPRDISLSRWVSDDEPQDDKVNNKDLCEAEIPFGRMSMESGEFREVYEADNGSSCSTRSISKADTVECEEQGNGVMQMDDECLSKLKVSSVDSIQGGMESVPSCRHVDEFEKLNRISEGTYGVVYKARDKRMGKVVAMKKVKILNNRDFEEYGFPLTSLREINILASMNHPSIVNIEEVVVDSKDTVFMVMEYMEHDLRGLLDKIKHPFSISEVKSLMFQLLEGVKYLHDNWVLHRDLKTSNILLNSKGELKICDFGMARQYGSPLQPYTTRVVTQFYRAPELLLGAKKYSTAVDMWSVGCIMAELLLTEPLFQGKNEIDQLAKIFRTLGTPNDKLWSGFSQLPGAKANFSYQPYNLLRKKFPAITFTFTGAVSLSESGLDLLNKLLTYDPQKRISAEDALNHSWFKEVPYAETLTFSTRAYS